MSLSRIRVYARVNNGPVSVYDHPVKGISLGKAAEVRRKTAAPPLLIVIDQFEEFLILHSEEQGESFAALLSNLVNDPIDGLRLLLVFRSDYRPLIFKLDLPRLAGGENWQELAPYDRAAAVSLLQGGGRELSSKALDALFRGLDRIEEAPGLYRPITLNMVGLVLRRMGHKLRGDPGQLIQSYLKDCLTAGESRDFAKPLLAAMITDAGTKEPRSEAELATLTGFEPWQVTGIDGHYEMIAGRRADETRATSWAWKDCSCRADNRPAG